MRTVTKTTTEDTSDLDDLLDMPDSLQPASVHVDGPDPFDISEHLKQSGFLTFDFETVPDESRFPRPEEVEIDEIARDFSVIVSGGASDVQDVIPALSDSQLIELREAEAGIKKPRKSVLDAIAKEQKARVEVFSKWCKSCSTSPLKARICAFGFAVGDNEPHAIISTNDDEERELLRAFWQLLNHCEIRCGYNIHAFDDPLAMFRSVIHKVESARPLSRKKFNNREAIDLQQRLFPSGLNSAESCKTVAKALGIHVPAGLDMDGSQVFPLFEAGMYDEIAEYVKSDVVVEREIYRRCGSLFGGE